MGYESRLYVVEKTNVIDAEKRYARVIAMFDMEKFTFLSDVLRTCPETDCYFYADDGNTQVLEDSYGRPLTEAPVYKVIDILGDILTNDQDIRDYDGCMRTLAALEYLKAIHTTRKRNIVVLHYGY